VPAHFAAGFASRSVAAHLRGREARPEAAKPTEAKSLPASRQAAPATRYT